MWQLARSRAGYRLPYRGVEVVAYPAEVFGFGLLRMRSASQVRSPPTTAPRKEYPISPHSQRLHLITADSTSPRASFADEVRRGLTSREKYLPCRFFYDRRGSQLFEQICQLPEYYPTRAEHSILEKRSDEIAESFDIPPSLVELGSGSATKTRLLIDSLLSHHGRLSFVPIDISRPMLEASAKSLLAEYPDLSVQAVAGEYEAGLRWLEQAVASPRLVLWLGSSVGNLDRESAARFLKGVAQSLESRDRLLLGIDLRKDPRVLERAYDDASGVTARFNLNLLTRVNRELGADFPVGDFRHRAIYREQEGRVEMHLVSRQACRVRIPACDLTVWFQAGESIHSENSHKYSRGEIDELAAAAGFAIDACWLDVDELFSLSLLSPV